MRSSCRRRENETSASERESLLWVQGSCSDLGESWLARALLQCCSCCCSASLSRLVSSRGLSRQREDAHLYEPPLSHSPLLSATRERLCRQILQNESIKLSPLAVTAWRKGEVRCKVDLSPLDASLFKLTFDPAEPPASSPHRCEHSGRAQDVQDGSVPVIDQAAP